MRVRIFLFLFALFLTLHPLTSDTQGAGVKPRRELLVSTAWLAKRIGRPDLTILHIAPDRQSYDQGHLPGARFVPLSEIIIARDGVPNELPSMAELQRLFTRLGVGNTGRIILYGEPNALSATRTLFTLTYLGHGARGAILDGGLESWKAENRPLEKESPNFSPATFTPHANPDLLIDHRAMRDLSWIATNIDGSDVTIIDSRSAEVYAGSAEKKTGHIPGAVNLFWMDHFEKKPGQAGKMRSIEDLRRDYASIGVLPGRLVATYCNTGMQSSHTWFTLRYLGYDALLYDGSMTEWSRLAGAPIVSGPRPK
ncbi:MAG: sulfurtransferase [Acidobacteriota bacterium]|jgi:thiosulfate/3-mercaptopyruvate sulfurtransferase